ncbi:AMP-dependent synthetase [Archaeoglobales archaeon]|nr:MAG: AMP-dependent synthetase [Archaeoglobales archaeon]
MAEKAGKLEIVWHPPKEVIERSNIKKFMDMHGIKSYEELLKRSTEDPEWFWDAIVKFLGIEFFEPYNKVLDMSKGIAWPKWFVGGKVNITHNCVNKHALSPASRNRVALIWESEDFTSRKLTYWEMYREVNKFSNALRSLGVKKGDAVGMFMPLIPETAIATYAIFNVGAIMCPLFSGYGPEAVATRLEDLGAKVLITVDGFIRGGKQVKLKEVATQVAERVKTLEHVVVVKRLSIDVPWTDGVDVWWHELIQNQPKHFETEKTDSEDVCIVGYTAGTSGKPKGVVLVHGGTLVKAAEAGSLVMDVHEDDTVFWITDFGWVMGPLPMIGTHAVGGTLLFYDGLPFYPSPDRLWDIVEKYGVTSAGVPPTALRIAKSFGDELVKKHDLSTLRTIVTTGEPIDYETWMWCFEVVGNKNVPIINASGGTEIFGEFVGSTVVMPLKPCCIGRTPGMDVDVFNDEGRPVRGEVGYLVCKKPTPAQTRGFWKDPDRYLKTYFSRWPNVWYHGDLIYVDEDGFWFHRGRADDVIKSSGRRLGPAEFEEVLLSHPAVAEAAAIGVPHPVKGSAVVCFAVLKPGYQPSEKLRDELKKIVAERLGKALTPDDIKFVEDLPKTRTMKVMRRLIKAKYLGEELGDTSGLVNPEALDAVERAK